MDSFVRNIISSSLVKDQGGERRDGYISLHSMFPMGSSSPSTPSSMQSDKGPPPSPHQSDDKETGDSATPINELLIGSSHITIPHAADLAGHTSHAATLSNNTTAPPNLLVRTIAPNLPRRSGPELWSLPSLPSFSMGASLLSLPNSTTAYITVEQRDYLKDIEHMREVLSNLELEVQKRCEEIISMYTANLSMYVIVITGGSMVNNYLSSDLDTSYGFIGLVVLCLVLGIAGSVYFNWKKIDTYTWRMNQVEKWRDQLRSDVSVFCTKLEEYSGVPDKTSKVTLSEARNRSKLIHDSIGFGKFRDDHKNQFIWISIWAIVYVSAMLVWIVVKLQIPGVTLVDIVKSLFG